MNKILFVLSLAALVPLSSCSHLEVVENKNEASRLYYLRFRAGRAGTGRYCGKRFYFRVLGTDLCIEESFPAALN